jgi:hypothetical protein
MEVNDSKKDECELEDEHMSMDKLKRDGGGRRDQFERSRKSATCVATSTASRAEKCEDVDIGSKRSAPFLFASTSPIE